MTREQRKHDFYVYAYIDPRDNAPFYIGKGRGRRATRHMEPGVLYKERSFFHNKLAKLLSEGVVPELRFIAAGLDEATAFALESFFILAIGRRNSDNLGPLCNSTNGGEGPSGLVHTTQHRERVSASIKKAWKRPGYREMRVQMGKTMWDSEEYREKQSVAQAAIWADPILGKQRADAIRAAKATEESRLRASMAAKKKWQDPSHQTKSAAAISKSARWRPPKGELPKGVYHERRTNKYYSQTSVGGHRISIGTYETIAKAAHAYDSISRLIHSGDCYVNFPMKKEWWEE